MVLRVMENIGTRVRDRTMLNKAVVQTVLLYGRYSWAITEATMEVLEEFQNRIMRMLTRKTVWCVGENGWEWTQAEDDIVAAGMWKMWECVRRRQEK